MSRQKKLTQRNYKCHRDFCENVKIFRVFLFVLLARADSLTGGEKVRGQLPLPDLLWDDTTAHSCTAAAEWIWMVMIVVTANVDHKRPSAYFC
ncbi:Uncharacterised protein [Escherichia coli]|uniref:Uncharacterized protein n=1 Tax=Escherichia coli TaxID=562 RepID=A0A376LML4_ECOLX|nr:Uncharacterised protein [Escherichia coli]